MSEHEPKPVAYRYEIQHGPEGEASYAWLYKGDEMIATMKTHHASAVTALQGENRKQTFRADSNHRIMLNHAEVSSAKSVEIQNLKAYIDKMTAEAQDAIGRERKRAEAAEKRALENEARANAAEQKLKDAVKLARIAIACEKMMNGAAIYFAADGERDNAEKLTKSATIMGEQARAFIKEAGE